MRNSDWFRPRSYLHFDNRISFTDRQRIEETIKNPKAVSRHGFLPFIRYDKDKPKVKVDEKTGKRFFEMGTRPICYASHWDAHIYAYYSSILGQIYESRITDLGLSENVIAFRKLYDPITNQAKCNIHLANDAFEAIKSAKTCKVFAFDIKSFFDTLDAKELKRQWSLVLNTSGLPEDHYAVFNSVTRYSTVNRDELFGRFGIPKNPNKQGRFRRICTPEEFREYVRGESLIDIHTKGIPQGSPISATLANIYMLEFDVTISRQINMLGGRYYRYCDDILIIIPSSCEIDIEGTVKLELGKIKLNLNPLKTDVSNFCEVGSNIVCDKPIQYLGFIFDGRVKSLRPASLSFYRRKLRKAINLSVSTKIKYDKIFELEGKQNKPVFTKSIFLNYSHVGQRTFISYGRRAQKIMKSEAIRRQLAGLDKFLKKEVAWARSK